MRCWSRTLLICLLLSALGRGCRHPKSYPQVNRYFFISSQVLQPFSYLCLSTSQLVTQDGEPITDAKDASIGYFQARTRGGSQGLRFRAKGSRLSESLTQQFKSLAFRVSGFRVRGEALGSPWKPR